MNNPCQGTTREWDIVELDEKIDRAHNTQEINYWKRQKEIIIRQSQDEGLEALRRELIEVNRQDTDQAAAAAKQRDEMVARGEGVTDEEEIEAMTKELASFEEKVRKADLKIKKKIKAVEARITDYIKGKNYEDTGSPDSLS